MRTSIRVIGTIIGFLLLFLGFLGFFMMLGNAMHEETGRFNDPKPLYSIRGIAIDSIGNLYYGNNDHSTIQVYSNKGSFLYRFSFPTGGAGYFAFYIDNDDVVHVATARTNKVFSFKEGDWIGERTYVDGKDESDTINDFERRKKKEFFDVEGNRYIISIRTVKMYDPNGIFVRKVSPSAPIWPFSIFMFWGIGALGIPVILLSNFWFFKKFFSALEQNRKA